jgi:hypothetical protein
MLRSLFRAACGALLSAALAATAVAQQVQPPAPPPSQPTVQQAPPSLLAQFDVMVGTVQDLQVPNGTPAAAIVDVVLGGRLVQLDLVQHEVRAPGFRLIERSASGEIVVPTPPCATYRGAVPGDAGSEVAASLRSGSLTAWIRLGSGDLWLVQAVREVQPTAGPGVHVVYHASDSRNLNGRCGVPGTVQGPVPQVIQEDLVYACQMGIEADYPFYQLNGSSTTATQNDITAVVNAMDVIYRRDTQITLQIGTIVVNTSADPYTTSSAGTLLNQFASYWNAYRGGISRDVAHLFTGRPMGATSGGTIGIAFLGVVCNLGSAYGVSQSRWTANWNQRIAVTAHELGHNFNAAHCDSAPPCHIMCSGVGGCANVQTSFSSGEQSQIIAFRQSVGCLPAQATTPAITSISPSILKTFRPPLLTLNGTGLTGTTAVTVGGHPVTSAISVLSDTQLRFTPPAGLPLGVHLVTVTNAAGTSSPSAVLYTAANPCEMAVPTGVLGGTTLTWQFGGWSNDPAFLVVSLLNTTHAFQGFPVLDGFSVLWTGGLDARGMGSFAVPVPAGILNGVRAYSQLLDFDGVTATLRSASAVASTLVVL